MKRIAFIIIACILSCHVYVSGQEDRRNPYDVNFRVQYNSNAHYPAGDQALYEHIYKNLKYSEDAKRNKIEGTVLLSFDVLPDSTLSGFVVLNTPGYGVEKDIIQILQQLKFAPAISNGVPIKQNIMLSIPVRAGMGSQ